MQNLFLIIFTALYLRFWGSKADQAHCLKQFLVDGLKSPYSMGILGIKNYAYFYGENMIEPRINSFCWSELATKNTDVTKKFYAGLFDWKYVEEDMPGDMGPYITIMVNDLPVGAMYKTNTMPSHWGSYILVKNCDDAVEVARKLKAKIVKEPFDVMEAGRMAVIKDPEGAFLNLWENKGHAGAAVQDQTHGAVCWHELLVKDPKNCLPFYAGLLGWSAEISQFDGQEYYSLKQPDKTPVGSMMPICSEMTCPPAWATYFTVSDLEKAMDYIKKNGGKIHFGPHEVHGMGYFACCEDATGAHFSIFEFSHGSCC